MSTTEQTQSLPTLSEKIKPTRTNARESKEVNAKIFELVVNQMNLEKGKDTSKKREGMSLRDRLRKKKQDDKKKKEEKEEEKKKTLL